LFYNQRPCYFQLICIAQPQQACKHHLPSALFMSFFYSRVFLFSHSAFVFSLLCSHISVSTPSQIPSFIVILCVLSDDTRQALPPALFVHLLWGTTVCMPLRRCIGNTLQSERDWVCVCTCMHVIHACALIWPLLLLYACLYVHYTNLNDGILICLWVVYLCSYVYILIICLTVCCFVCFFVPYAVSACPLWMLACLRAYAFSECYSYQQHTSMCMVGHARLNYSSSSVQVL
jgi:hypothetical protein